MNFRAAEAIATILAALAIAGATVWPFFHEGRSVREKAPPDARIVTLTGVAVTGTWTDEEVHGGNYWRRSFPPARPLLRAGRPVLLRLKSSDVIHAFYCPALGIGPVEVYPGHVEEILFTPRQAGGFEYYCTTFCGDPHFAMRGSVIVRGEGEEPPPAPGAKGEEYWKEPPPSERTLVARGGWLYRQKGCHLCHGPEGRGGVPNFNYVKDTVPSLDVMAERMMLHEKEHAQHMVGLLERGAPLSGLSDNPPFPRYNAVMAQYGAVKDVIRKGSPPGKKAPDGPVPPLDMPPWEHHLTDRDIDALIAYLLTLQPWEEEEKDK